MNNRGEIPGDPGREIRVSDRRFGKRRAEATAARAGWTLVSPQKKPKTRGQKKEKTRGQKTNETREGK